MAYFLYGLFFISCLVLVGAVLLQPGKTDAGALFTSNVSNTNYQPRGAQSVLAKLTIIAATTFMLSALLLSLPSLTGNVSVIQTAGDDVPAIGSNTNTATDANAANSNADTDANAVNANVAENAPANTDESTGSEVNSAEKKADEKSEEKPAENSAEGKTSDKESEPKP